jgi:hypothetical protein
MHESEPTTNLADQANDPTADVSGDDRPPTQKRRRSDSSGARRSAGSEPDPFDRLASEPPESFGEVQ